MARLKVVSHKDWDMDGSMTNSNRRIEVLDDNQGYVELVNWMGDETTIINAARVSFGKTKATFDDKDEKLLNYLIKNQHLTPLEHVLFTFRVHCPLYIRSQWHRHRKFSYNEISRRYTEFDLKLYKPSVYREQSEDNKQASVDKMIDENDRAVLLADGCMNECVAIYDKLLNMGVCREQARGVLPQNLMTTFWATTDLRNLLHFIQLREDNHAQKEMREYAVAIKTLIEPIVPHVIKYFNEQIKKQQGSVTK